MDHHAGQSNCREFADRDAWCNAHPGSKGRPSFYNRPHEILGPLAWEQLRQIPVRGTWKAIIGKCGVSPHHDPILQGHSVTDIDKGIDLAIIPDFDVIGDVGLLANQAVTANPNVPPDMDPAPNGGPFTDLNIFFNNGGMIDFLAGHGAQSLSKASQNWPTPLEVLIWIHHSPRLGLIQELTLPFVETPPSWYLGTNETLSHNDSSPRFGS